ncbi:MAG: rhomboid family intramembrane serine protease, partial [Chthoniobacterales bacterium]
MPDLNYILLFLACVSPVIVLVKTARSSTRNRGWWLAAIAVLIVTALAYLILPRYAGFIGGGAWLVLLLFPMMGLQRTAEAVTTERYSIARKILGLVTLVHPSRALAEERELLRALELAQRGEVATADEILQRLSRQNTAIGRRAAAHRFFIRRDWEGLLDWCRQNIPRVGLGDDATLLPLYYRSLGELHLHDELVRQFAGRVPSLLASPVHQSTFVLSLLTVLAFCGRSAAVEKILQTRLRRLPNHAKHFWRATSAAAAPLLSLPTESTVDRFAHAVTRRGGSILPRQTFRITPAVTAVIAINVAFFIVEVWLGGSMNPFVLHRLGALEPTAVLVAGQYWRLVAAIFLHFGALHLIVNLYALYILGPALETTLGTLRFALCYFLSGIGSSLGVVALWRLGFTQTDSLVGASGAVMGIVGTWAGFLALHRHVPDARRRLYNIIFIVVIQTTFDLYFPQVSLSAHICGLTSG